LLDEALTLYFQAPKTYTGENILELHLHGGTAIIQSVLNTIGSLHDPDNGINIRYAQNGEFSQRAFINGRFDLTELEGVREMIDAETETQRIAALSSLTGDSKKIFHHWREQIVNNIALLTTVIDFGEEHDLEEVAELFNTVDSNITAISTDINQYLAKIRRSEILMKGIKLVLLGPPNAGKSSILNFLANKDAAIVSDIAGTTRDVIDVPLDIAGYKVVVGDTAGIRSIDLADSIEREGIKRAKDKSLTSDLVLVILPLDGEVDHHHLAQHISVLKTENKKIVVILNKQDLIQSTNYEPHVESLSTELGLAKDDFHVVSCLTGYGMSELSESLVHQFKTITQSESTDPVVISARAQDLLVNDVLYGFEQFKVWKEQEDVVLATESLKQSAEGIGKITGDAIGVEEILGVVFSSFCIGK
jgi:tRNA modification GTPase